MTPPKPSTPHELDTRRRELQQRLSDAGDRRDWEACDDAEAALAALPAQPYTPPPDFDPDPDVLAVLDMLKGKLSTEELYVLYAVVSDEEQREELLNPLSLVVARAFPERFPCFDPEEDDPDATSSTDDATNSVVVAPEDAVVDGVSIKAGDKLLFKNLQVIDSPTDPDAT